MMKEGQYIITFNPASPPNHQMIKMLADKKVIGHIRCILGSHVLKHGCINIYEYVQFKGIIMAAK